MYSEQVVSSEKEVVSCAQLLNALYSTYADAITLPVQVAWFDYIQYPYIPICLPLYVVWDRIIIPSNSLPKRAAIFFLDYIIKPLHLVFYYFWGSSHKAIMAAGEEEESQTGKGLPTTVSMGCISDNNGSSSSSSNSSSSSSSGTGRSSYCCYVVLPTTERE